MICALPLLPTAGRPSSCAVQVRLIALVKVMCQDGIARGKFDGSCDSEVAFPKVVVGGR